jgi:hypothetical protein
MEHWKGVEMAWVENGHCKDWVKLWIYLWFKTNSQHDQMEK